MKFPAIIAPLLFAFCLSAQDTLNRVDMYGKRQGYWKITAAMAKRAEFPDQQSIVEEGNYVDGKKTGNWIQHYPNGNIRSRIPFENNRASGYSILYYESGHIKECGTWKNARWIGEYKLFYETDTLRMKLQFNNDGRRHGPCMFYHENGKLMIESYYKNGREDSIYREFYDDGSLRKECFYSNATIDPSRTKTHDPPPGAHWHGDAAKPKNEIQYGHGQAQIEFHASDSVLNAQRQKVFVDSIYYALNCFKKMDDGSIVLYKDKKITHKGLFENWKLVCGICYVYDDEGRLVAVKVYEDGNFTRDVPVPNRW